jgi:hypothetical protein
LSKSSADTHEHAFGMLRSRERKCDAVADNEQNTDVGAAVDADIDETADDGTHVSHANDDRTIVLEGWLYRKSNVRTRDVRECCK